MGLFTLNMKPNIFDNRSKSTFNNIVGCNVLPTIGASKTVYPIKSLG